MTRNPLRRRYSVLVILIAGGIALFATLGATGSSSNTTNPKPSAAEAAVAGAFEKYLVLQQSTLVPLSASQATQIASTPVNASSTAKSGPGGSAAAEAVAVGWPNEHVSSPPSNVQAASAPAPAPTDGSGHLSISSTDVQNMEKLGTGAFESVTTSRKLPDVVGALSGAYQAQMSRGFEVIAGGADVIGYSSISISGNTATVKAEYEEWQIQRGWDSTGTPQSHTITNREVGITTLVEDALGNWQVDTDQWQFVPGYGP
jgi:hypothetical protein